MKKTLFALAFILCITTAHATVYYVDSAKTDNNGAGTSWATAKKDIQNAINLALIAGDEVWVKKGTYYPTQRVSDGTVDRHMSFQPGNGVKLYGGFAGTETLLAQRNLGIAGNRSIMSGDIGIPNDTSDNCLHVIVTGSGITNTTIIDGFTITKGVASRPGIVGSFFEDQGGGLYNVGSPMLRNLIFIENFCNFYGGGIYNRGGTPTMNNIAFERNHSYEQGGAILNVAGHLQISDCTFTGNSSSSFGGGILNYRTMTLNGVRFSGNAAEVGGAIHNQGNFTITNAQFIGNIANDEGGGICNYSGSIKLSYVVFSDNLAAGNGGSALVTRGDTTSVISNALFIRNRSAHRSSQGNAVRIYADGNTTFNNCSFFENISSSLFRGGAIYMSGNAGASINNCIFWNNTTPSSSTAANREEIFSDNTTATRIQINNSIVRDATGSPLAIVNATLTNCSNKDPMFVNGANPLGADGIGMTADDGLALQPCSPAINAGIMTTSAAPTDIMGNNRVGNYDIGAYEYQDTASQPVLATASSSARANQLGTITYGNCTGILATIATPTNSIAGSTAVNMYLQPTAPLYLGQPYVRRYYDITPTTNASTAMANVTLYFNQADFDNYNSNNATAVGLPTGPADNTGISNLRITQQHGTSATGLPGSFTGWAGTGPANVLINPADSNIIWNNAAGRWEVTFAVTGFSGFFVHTGASVPLPLNLISFTAQSEGKVNRLEWAALMDEPGPTFTIERSKNANNFEEIGKQAADRSHCVFYDDQPLSPISYYRLRITEAGGLVNYSKTVKVHRSVANDDAIRITPVPANNFVTITCTGTSLFGTNTKVYDMTGRMVLSFCQLESMDIDISNWAMGVYTLHFSNGAVKRLAKHN